MSKFADFKEWQASSPKSIWDFCKSLDSRMGAHNPQFAKVISSARTSQSPSILIGLEKNDSRAAIIIGNSVSESICIMSRAENLVLAPTRSEKLRALVRNAGPPSPVA